MCRMYLSMKIMNPNLVRKNYSMKVSEECIKFSPGLTANLFVSERDTENNRQEEAHI